MTASLQGLFGNLPLMIKLEIQIPKTQPIHIAITHLWSALCGKLCLQRAFRRPLTANIQYVTFSKSLACNWLTFTQTPFPHSFRNPCHFTCVQEVCCWIKWKGRWNNTFQSNPSRLVWIHLINGWYTTTLKLLRFGNQTIVMSTSTRGYKAN